MEISCAAKETKTMSKRCGCVFLIQEADSRVCLVMKNSEIFRTYAVWEMKINHLKRSVRHNYLGEFGQQMIDRGREVEEVVAVTDQTVLGASEAVGTVKHSS